MSDGAQNGLQSRHRSTASLKSKLSLVAAVRGSSRPWDRTDPRIGQIQHSAFEIVLMPSLSVDIIFEGQIHRWLHAWCLKKDLQEQIEKEKKCSRNSASENETGLVVKLKAVM